MVEDVGLTGSDLPEAPETGVHPGEVPQLQVVVRTSTGHGGTRRL